MKLTYNRRFALISYMFNEGEPKFHAPTLLRLLNEGDALVWTGASVNLP